MCFVSVLLSFLKSCPVFFNLNVFSMISLCFDHQSHRMICTLTDNNHHHVLMKERKYIMKFKNQQSNKKRAEEEEEEEGRRSCSCRHLVSEFELCC